jgi:hypothetical protein
MFYDDDNADPASIDQVSLMIMQTFQFNN